MSEYRFESVTSFDIVKLKQSWLALQQDADCSFFQSWGWIGTWLSEIADNLSPQLITVFYGNQIVGLGAFVSADLRRHHLIRSRAMFLHEAPFGGNNMVIEYNGLLAANGHEAGVYTQTLRGLLDTFPAVDEFYFGAIKAVSPLKLATAKRTHALNFISEKTSTCRLVLLDRIGANIDDYLKSLGKNRRLQIKRSLRLYNESAPVLIDAAQTTEQALVFFDGLKKLHTERWKNSGKPGAFANTRWEHFHRELIKRCFGQGEIQLLKVYHANDDIAYLYNFIWRKQVYVLQTGFAISDDKRLQPGYVAHTLAILYNKDKGMEIYDLMHGDDLYKRLLCNHSETLSWVVIQRKRLRFALENSARLLVRKLRSS